MTTQKQATTYTIPALDNVEISPAVEEALAKMQAAGKGTDALSDAQRTGYIKALCKALRLNPLTQPVQFIKLSGREVLYVTRTATDQLAAMHNLNRKTIRGPEIVDIGGSKVAMCVVEVTLPGGRCETATATLPVSDPASLYMKLECVPLDSEILTRRGFKRHDEIRIGEDVLAYDAGSDRCEWVPLENVTTYPSASVSTFATAGGGFSFRCTPNHSWAVDTMGLAGRKLIEARHVKTQHRVRIAAPAPGGDHPLTPECAAVLGWVMCDGGIRRVGNYVSLSITQSKPRRVAEIRALLARADLHPREDVGDATVRTFPGGNTSACLPQHVFSLRVEESREVLAAAGIEGPADMPRLVTRLSQPARRAMLDAMLAADGTGGHTFGKKRKPGVMEAWQILCTLEGIALGKMGTSSVGDVPVQRMLTYDYVAGNNVALAPDGEAPVWCPTTRHGTWVMRQGGRISITGNTKAKRRATLAILGLGLLSEEEAESIPGAEKPGEQSDGAEPSRAFAAFRADLDACSGLREVGVCWQAHSQALHSADATDEATAALADALTGHGYDLIAGEQHSLCTGTWPVDLCAYLDGLAALPDADRVREHYQSKRGDLVALGEPHVTVAKRSTARAVARLRECSGDDARRFLAATPEAAPVEQPAAEAPTALDGFLARVAEIELPGEAVAVWMKWRAEVEALPSAVSESAWAALCKRTEEVGKMRNAATWLRKCIAEEDTRRASDANTGNHGAAA